MWRRPVACELAGYQPAPPTAAVMEYVSGLLISRLWSGFNGCRCRLGCRRWLAQEDIDSVVFPVHRPTGLDHHGCSVLKIVGFNLLCAVQKPGLLRSLESEDLVFRGVDGDFGDGAGSTDQHPIHQYEKAGEYIVNLYIEGPGGKSRWTKVRDVVVR